MKDCAMTIQTFATWDWSSPTGKNQSARERERNTTTTNLQTARKESKERKKENRERTTETESHLVRAGSRNDDSSGRDGKHIYDDYI